MVGLARLWVKTYNGFRYSMILEVSADGKVAVPALPTGDTAERIDYECHAPLSVARKAEAAEPYYRKLEKRGRRW